MYSSLLFPCINLIDELSFNNQEITVQVVHVLYVCILYSMYQFMYTCVKYVYVYVWLFCGNKAGS